MICASSVTDFHPLATWVGIIFPTDNAKIQFCAPGCQEAPPFWRRFNTSRACHSERSEESECASKSIILLMFTDSPVPSEWQEMEAPVCLQFLYRLTIAKSGFVRIIQKPHSFLFPQEGKSPQSVQRSTFSGEGDNFFRKDTPKI